MLADDNAHLSELTFLLITLCPLAPIVVLTVGWLFTWTCCKDKPPPPPQASLDDEEDDDCLSTNKTKRPEDLAENSLEQPLVVDIAQTPTSKPAATDKAPNTEAINTGSPPFTPTTTSSLYSGPYGYNDVSHICRTPLSAWRQAGGSALLLCSLGSFVGLQVGCYLFKDGADIVPRDESVGLLAVALSGFLSIVFYRPEVKLPLRVIEARRGCSRKLTFRSSIMLIFWLIMLAAQCYRICRLVMIYREDWWMMKKVFCVLQLIADAACALICIPSFIFFTLSERPRENQRLMLLNIYKKDTIPYISPKLDKPLSPEDRINAFKLLTFVWLERILRKGRKMTLTHSDLYALRKDDQGAILYARYAALEKKLKKKKIEERERASSRTHALGDTNTRETHEVNLYKLIWQFLNPTFLFAAVIKLVYDSVSLLDVLIVNLLVKYMSSSADAKSVGLVLCGLLALNAYLETFLINQYFQRMLICGVRVRSCLATAVFQKSMRVDQSQLAQDSTSQFTSGKIINLMSTDAQRVGDVMSYIQILWSAPYQIIICSVMLYKQLGLASLGGIGIMILSIPLSALITKRTRRLQKGMMELKDERLKSTSELIQGIKAIKIYTWEIPFMNLINGIRADELEALKKSQYTNSMSRFMINAIPVAVALVSFAIYVCAQKETITPAVAFTSLALFESLRFPLLSLPFVIMSSAEAIVTMKRMKAFMALPELHQEDDEVEERMMGESQVDGEGSDVKVLCKNLTIGFHMTKTTPEAAAAAAAGGDTAPTATVSSNDITGTEDDGTDSASAGVVVDKILTRDFNLTLKTGQYIALIGRTGCGKTVLINTILRELQTVMNGYFKIRGKVALCEQTAWIQSGSIRDNILFGQPFDNDWYEKVIHACALEKDFEILKDGDQTEIGERGVNLSGGQKQRIALARAVYFNAEIYILDDILSAVDAHVSLHLYQNVIKGILKDKAIILSTHRFECLREADTIFMLRKGKNPLVFNSLREAESNEEFIKLADSTAKKETVKAAAAAGAAAATGAVPPTAAHPPALPPTPENRLTPSRSGSVRNLPSVTPLARGSPSGRSFEISPSACFSQELIDVLEGTDDREKEEHEHKGDEMNEPLLSPSQGPTTLTLPPNTTAPTPLPPPPASSPAKLVDDEMMVEGSVKGEVYVSYIKAGGGWLAVIGLLIVLTMTQGVTLGANFWLSHWSDHSASITSMTGLTIYIVIQVASLLILIVALVSLILVTQRAAKYYHGRMLSRIIHAKMSFFESTPIGRLTNKFSKDLYTIDDLLPMTLYQFLNMLISVLSSIIAIAVVLPIMLAIIFPVMILYAIIERLYVSVARQFKRLDSVSRSPLFTHFNECLDGARSIRAMKQKGYFLGIHLKYLDLNLSATYIYTASNRWLSVRLESLGNLIVVGVALFCVLMRSKITGGKAGLALSYAIKITGYLNWLVRMSGDRESNIVAVERVLEYDDDQQCPQEDYQPRVRLENENDELGVGVKGLRVGAGGLSRIGSSSKTGSSSKITPNLPIEHLLSPGQVEFRGVSLRYRPELPFALKSVSFKIAGGEKVGVVGRTGAGKSSLLVSLLRLVDITEGRIFVHDLDSSIMTVSQLRNQISIIPQESVIFSGTLRRNLDPFDKKTDPELWESLSKACLKEFVEGLPGQLDYKITENGGNISVGQKQLLCLARVLLKNAQILLLDEATSAVDPQTDAQIQKCLRTEFQGITIITIAHRLKTVADYDRIIVMANGEILEEGNPQLLLKDPSSEFYQMYYS